jgi:membrane protease subunit HflK
MVDAKGGNNLLYLPLDKLIAQQVASDAAAGKPGTATPPAANLGGSNGDAIPSLESQQRQRDSRGRDGRDSRDRETR